MKSLAEVPTGDAFEGSANAHRSPQVPCCGALAGCLLVGDFKKSKKWMDAFHLVVWRNIPYYALSFCWYLKCEHVRSCTARGGLLLFLESGKALPLQTRAV
jgi:hypothetical protein